MFLTWASYQIKIQYYCDIGGTAKEILEEPTMITFKGLGMILYTIFKIMKVNHFIKKDIMESVLGN